MMSSGSSNNHICCLAFSKRAPLPNLCVRTSMSPSKKHPNNEDADLALGQRNTPPTGTTGLFWLGLFYQSVLFWVPGIFDHQPKTPNLTTFPPTPPEPLRSSGVGKFSPHGFHFAACQQVFFCFGRIDAAFFEV